MDSSAEPQQNPVWLLNVGAVRLAGAVSRISEGSGSSQKLDEVRLPALRGRWAQLVGGGSPAGRVNAGCSRGGAWGWGGARYLFSSALSRIGPARLCLMLLSDASL